tara:strand:- start:3094 stop:3372 length:279 start_codon:yes stop_codon:yes gene_type:complete
MKIKIKRLFNGKVDIRDYALQGCLNKWEPVVFELDGERMTIPPDRFGEGTHTQTVKSKFDGKEYGLISFKWKPDEKADPQVDMWSEYFNKAT